MCRCVATLCLRSQRFQRRSPLPSQRPRRRKAARESTRRCEYIHIIFWHICSLPEPIVKWPWRQSYFWRTYILLAEPMLKRPWQKSCFGTHALSVVNDYMTKAIYNLYPRFVFPFCILLFFWWKKFLMSSSGHTGGTHSRACRCRRITCACARRYKHRAFYCSRGCARHWGIWCSCCRCRYVYVRIYLCTCKCTPCC